jgi:hypothetical protein
MRRISEISRCVEIGQFTCHLVNTADKIIMTLPHPAQGTGFGLNLECPALTMAAIQRPLQSSHCIISNPPYTHIHEGDT